ncbi:MAG: serine/threonine-protein kinase [Ilumatobacter sp.]|uniref:serine/threonine-protein kinase n=1 Tax=Ilumatobacter sp. TaxID=1967498 RepID=UPI003C72B7F1
MSDRADPSRGGEPVAPLSAIVDGFEDFVRIGSGGFSSVYSARQVRMGRPVAIKVLHADLGNDADRRVFERECEAMGVLSRHPNIATVYSEATTIDGRACLVMELYHGNYRDRLDASGPLPLDEFLSLGVKVAGALQAAHDMGILHRDIKPHNIFLSDFGEPALGDFGISTIEGERSITGAAALSVAYSAPEVIEDGPADFLSDVYSLAATLHHLAAGVSPFAAPHISGVMNRILNDDPDPLNRPDAPVGLQDLLRRGLAKDPSDRPDSAGDLAWSLQDLQAELGFARTTVPLTRSERFEPEVRTGVARSTADDGVTSTDDAEATIPPPEAPRYVEPARPIADAATPPIPRGPQLGSFEPTIRRGAAGFDDAHVADDQALEQPADELLDPVARRGWAVDAAIVIAVVALVAFALSRML